MCPCFYYNAVLWFLLCSGMFSPTIFSLLFGHLNCVDCEPQTILVPLQPSNQSTNTSIKPGFQCRVCTQSVVSWCAHNLNQWWVGVHTVCAELVCTQSVVSWCAHSLCWVGVHSLWWVGVHTVCGELVCTVCGELVCTQSVVSWCAQSVVSWCAHSLWWVGVHTVSGEVVCI